MTPPLVSVAIATWNGAKYLREQLETIYGQTGGIPEIEVVASDDASTDGTVAILAEYALSRGLRYVVNPSRLGLVRNFERAISLCTGELIALADQDDLWKPHKLATLVENLGDFTLIYCNSQEVLCPDGRTSARYLDPTGHRLRPALRHRPLEPSTSWPRTGSSATPCCFGASSFARLSPSHRISRTTTAGSPSSPRSSAGSNTSTRGSRSTASIPRA